MRICACYFASLLLLILYKQTEVDNVRFPQKFKAYEALKLGFINTSSSTVRQNAGSRGFEGSQFYRRMGSRAETKLKAFWQSLISEAVSRTSKQLIDFAAKDPSIIGDPVLATKFFWTRLMPIGVVSGSVLSFYVLLREARVSRNQRYTTEFIKKTLAHIENKPQLSRIITSYTKLIPSFSRESFLFKVLQHVILQTNITFPLLENLNYVITHDLIFLRDEEKLAKTLRLISDDLHDEKLIGKYALLCDVLLPGNSKCQALWLPQYYGGKDKLAEKIFNLKGEIYLKLVQEKVENLLTHNQDPSISKFVSTVNKYQPANENLMGEVQNLSSGCFKALLKAWEKVRERVDLVGGWETLKLKQEEAHKLMGSYFDSIIQRLVSYRSKNQLRPRGIQTLPKKFKMLEQEAKFLHRFSLGEENHRMTLSYTQDLYYPEMKDAISELTNCISDNVRVLSASLENPNIEDETPEEESDDDEAVERYQNFKADVTNKTNQNYDRLAKEVQSAYSTREEEKEVYEDEPLNSAPSEVAPKTDMGKFRIFDNVDDNNHPENDDPFDKYPVSAISLGIPQLHEKIARNFVLHILQRMEHNRWMYESGGFESTLRCDYDDAGTSSMREDVGSESEDEAPSNADDELIEKINSLPDGINQFSEDYLGKTDAENEFDAEESDPITNALNMGYNVVFDTQQSAYDIVEAKGQTRQSLDDLLQQHRADASTSVDNISATPSTPNNPQFECRSCGLNIFPASPLTPRKKPHPLLRSDSNSFSCPQCGAARSQIVDAYSWEL